MPSLTEGAVLVDAWVMRGQGLMLVAVAAIGLRYGVYAIAFSTRGFWSEKERSSSSQMMLDTHVA